MTGGGAVGAPEIALHVERQRRRSGANADLAVVAYGQLGGEVIARIERADRESVRAGAGFADHHLQTRARAVHAIESQRRTVIAAAAVPEIELVVEQPEIAFNAQIAFDPDQFIRAHGWHSVAAILEPDSAIRRLDGFGHRAAVVARNEMAGLILHRQPAHVADRYQPARAILRIGKALLRN